MSYTIKNNTKVAVKEESVEGVYEAPTAGSDYIQILADGMEMNPTRDLLERNVLGLGLGKASPRTGLKSVAGSLPAYMQAGSTAAAEPAIGRLMQGALGSKRNSASVTTGVGNTATVLQVADTTNLKANDIVVVKEAGAYHTSPIASLITNTSITLLIPMSAAPADAVEIEAFTTYVCSNEGHPSFSVSKYVDNAILESAIGSKVTSMSLEGFTTGQIATMNFAFEGLNFDRSLTAPPAGFEPAYDTSETPIILTAKIYQNGNQIEVNEFTMSVENSIGFVQNIDEGKVSSRVTARAISGSINPYKLSNSIDNFTKFNANTPFSLFVTAKNPKATAGEYQESISFYMPLCLITEIGESDSDGILQEAISFTANTQNGSVGELFISIS